MVAEKKHNQQNLKSTIKHEINTHGLIHIYPEGTITTGEYLLPFHDLAFTCDEPILPMVIKINPIIPIHTNYLMDYETSILKYFSHKHRALTYLLINNIIIFCFCPIFIYKVEFLPPSQKRLNETVAMFNERIHNLIASSGNFKTIGVPLSVYKRKYQSFLLKKGWLGTDNI